MPIENTIPPKEPDAECFPRHTRHYLAKSLIRLDELEARLRYPAAHQEPPDLLKIVAEIKGWQMDALAAASGRSHTVPILR